MLAWVGKPVLVVVMQPDTRAQEQLFARGLGLDLTRSVEVMVLMLIMASTCEKLHVDQSPEKTAQTFWAQQAFWVNHRRSYEQTRCRNTM